MYALPRISWDGRLTSLRAMRVLLSGVTFAPVKPTRSGKLAAMDREEGGDGERLEP
jgi:hypothetical protein